MPYFEWKGHRIHYRRQGHGPLLLVLPGNTASSACHLGELDYFADRCCTVSMDFLGTGGSDRLAQWPADWWSQSAGQARALVEHLGFRDCVAMGTSGGAAIALLMAIHHPEVVKAVIADSCVEFFSKDMLEANVIRERNQRTQGQVDFWSYAHGPDWEQVIAADTGMLIEFTQSGGDWFSGRLMEIRCPVLLTASRKDSALENVVAQNSSMCVQMPDARLYIGNEGDHPFMWSSPKEFRALTPASISGTKATTHLCGRLRKSSEPFVMFSWIPY